MNVALMVVGALALGALVGWLVGRWDRGRPVRLCTHHLGTHDPDTGACQAAVSRSYENDSGRLRTEWVDCACLRYVGPALPRRWMVTTTTTGGEG